MELKNKNPFIILIAGRARSGKSTVARYMEKYYLEQNKKVVISPYTNYLKQYIMNITKEPIDDDHKPRDLLQKISSELIKKELGKTDFFIKRQIEDIEIYSYFMDIIIVPDVRFPEEIEVIKKKFSNVISIGVIRENYQSDLTLAQQMDTTETSLDNYTKYDYLIKNRTEEKLYQSILDTISSMEERMKINE